MAEVLACARFNCAEPVSGSHAGHCSNKCYQKTWYENRRGIDRESDQSRVCALDSCGNRLTGRQTRAIYCSRECKTTDFWAKNPGYAKIWAREHRPWEARRAREKSAFIAGVDLGVISDRIEYLRSCWICGGASSERDHVKPIAKGGSHIPANIRPICSTCNKIKSDRWFGVARLAELKELVLFRREILQCR